MTNQVLELDFPSVTFVTLNLRAADKQEVYGLLSHDSPVLLALEVMAALGNHGRGRVVWHDGKPAAIVGFAEYRKGVWQIVMLGTNDFRAASKDCLRWIRDTARDLIENHGGRRLQCDSHEHHHEAHRFLRALGARAEGPPMLGYGKDGCAYQRFVWFASEGSRLIERNFAHANG